MKTRDEQDHVAKGDLIRVLAISSGVTKGGTGGMAVETIARRYGKTVEETERDLRRLAAIGLVDVVAVLGHLERMGFIPFQNTPIPEGSLPPLWSLTPRGWILAERKKRDRLWQRRPA